MRLCVLIERQQGHVSEGVCHVRVLSYGRSYRLKEAGPGHQHSEYRSLLMSKNRPMAIDGG